MSKFRRGYTQTVNRHYFTLLLEMQLHRNCRTQTVYKLLALGTLGELAGRLTKYIRQSRHQHSFYALVPQNQLAQEFRNHNKL